MWGAPEEPPDDTEVAGFLASAPEPTSSVREVCEDNKSQLETFKDIMLKNKKDMKKKEEELQEYASKLSEIKSRAKRSRRSKDSGAMSVETTPKSRVDESLLDDKEDTVDDISQARTPKAKSSLLQRKLAENRKIFEQRSKEMTESKRAVEEKVEAIRQQMDQTDITMVESQRDPLIVTPVRPVLIPPQIVSSSDLQMGFFQDKDNKIAELSNRILELEATVIDLQDNLKEKDSVIDSKTRAVTLMSADLSKKGKSTLDTLEDTKDEMRTMQENFVLIESSLRGKNENLLEQLREQNDRVTDLESTINRYEQEMEEKRLAETASASLSRTTIDTLADTKDAMRSMQENFILIETSLREKNDNLLQQLQERDTKLAEAEEKIYKFESGAGIAPPPEIPDLRYKIDRLEQSNRALQDEKYQLQKSNAELQEKIVSRESSNGNGLIVEKDNRIAELENLIEELKNSNQLLEEESKAELQKQVDELATKNDEFRCKIDDLERLNNDLEIEKNELRAKMPDDSGVTKETAMVMKLTKELEDLNKSMIKLKAQHKGKLRNLQRQLESFKMVSDVNSELVKLGNQVALLEEEKGNLQLSLVDFDELKASAGDWQDRIADLESRVSTQANDIQANIEAIAILENQKLDLMQELHTAKQEISALEAENAESENLRVTAEMKIVDMEEQLESMHKLHNENVKSVSAVEKSSDDFLRKIENPIQDNSEIVQRIVKHEEKASSETGSTESFESIHEDRNELMKKLEALSARNRDLEEKLLKLEEASRSNIGSTESFETINDTDKSELAKKIDLLSRENSDLLTRLNKYEEKGSSDTGSTESFERIPEHHDDGITRIEILTRENNDLVIKLTKLEEKFDNLLARQTDDSVELTLTDGTPGNDEKLDILTRENSDLAIELTKVQEKLSRVTDDLANLRKSVDDAEKENTTVDDFKIRVESLTMENHDLIIKLTKLEEKNAELRENLEKIDEKEAVCHKNREDENLTGSATIVSVTSLEIEIETCRKLITEQNEFVEEMKTKLADKESELELRIKEIEDYEAKGIIVENLQRELKDNFDVIEEWKYKCASMEEKMKILEAAKIAIEEGLEVLKNENSILIEENGHKDVVNIALKEELDYFADSRDTEREVIGRQEREIENLREYLRANSQELQEKCMTLQDKMIHIDGLREELNDCRGQLERHENTIVSLNGEIENLKAETIVNNERVSTYLSQIDTLREDLGTKGAKEAKNEQLIAELREAMNVEIRENGNLKSEIEKSNNEVENLRTLLNEKNNEVASLVEVKLLLENKIRETSIAKDMVESKFQSVQSNFDDRAKYADDLRVELSNTYRMLELLKIKHTEDVEMQNQRLEELILDLNGKTTECEVLRTQLDDKIKVVRELEARRSELEICREQLTEKEILVGRNVTEKVKIDLELRVKELEEKLLESEANIQTQLQKRKILAANLKKKSSQCEELEVKSSVFEAKVRELEPKLTELEAKVSELEANVAELEPKAAQFESRAMELGIKSAEYEAKATELETKVSELEANVAQLEPKAAQFEEKAVKLEAKVTELEANVAELEANIRELECKAVESEAKSTELGIKATEFQAQATELGIKASEFEAKVQQLEFNASTNEAKAFEYETKAAEYEAKACKFESEASHFRGKASEFEAKIEELEPKVATLEIKASEFEAKAIEFEEKWITEKSEKDTSNVKLLENERTIRDKSETILHLENQLKIAQNEVELSMNKVETLSTELYNSTEKITTLTSQLSVMIDEMDKLRTEIDERSSELRDEIMTKEKLIVEYEERRQCANNEETLRQQILDESKEKARELGVRMQVMETEYVEQLNTIQTLRTENGMLLSKQAQINERLENAEKEASERKILLDRIQRETHEREADNFDNNANTSDNEQSRNDEKQSCDHCGQCQTVVQALEAKLQERDAEIENLDNELANSIGNFVHMRESLRVSDLMNQSSSRSRSHEETRDELVSQYNALNALNAELRDKLNLTIRENQELREKIVSLQALNVALRERTGAAEDELFEGHDTTTRLQNADTLNNCQVRENELENARGELETMKERHDEWITSTRLEIEQLESRNSELTRHCDELRESRNEAEREIVSLRQEIDRCQRRTLELENDAEKYKDESVKYVVGDSNVRETGAASSLFVEEKDDGPKLFDAAKLFGPMVTMDSNENRELADLRNVLATKELENIRLSQEIIRLGEQIVNLESYAVEINSQNARELETSRDNCQKLETELTELRNQLVERDRQIDSLNSELNHVRAQLVEQFNQHATSDEAEITIETLRMENEEHVNRLRDTEGTIVSLTAGNVELVGKLENSQKDNVQWFQTIDAVNSILDGILTGSEDDKIQILANLRASSPVIHTRLVEITKYLDTVKNEKNELLVLMDNCKLRISTLEEELRNCGDSTRIQELEERADRVIRERDIKQLQVNDLARSLEEMQETMEKASSNEEIRLRNLQASLDRALSDNDQLKIQLGDVVRERETVAIAYPQKLSISETLEKVRSEELEASEVRESLQLTQSSDLEVPTVEDIGWDDETKLDEEMWSWNPEDAQLSVARSIAPSDTLLPSLERRLNAKIAELEDTIRDDESERDRLNEEIKQTQIKIGKMLKKLKEFKIQNESLRQQLKIQKATADFCDLDTAIEDELKLQIERVEKELKESKEETKKTSLERDNLSKRIDVLSSANERLVEMKERQDMEMEVLQIRTKELLNKLHSMEWHIRETCDDQTSQEVPSTSVSSNRQRTQVEQMETPRSDIETEKFECLCKKYKEEIDELRDEMEALGAENEQLQKLLEEQRATRLSTESKLKDQLSESAKEIENLSGRNSEIQKKLEDSQVNYQSLLDQCDRSTKHSDEQIFAARQSHDILNNEFALRTTNFEAELASMSREMNSTNLAMNELKENLRILIIEKEELIERTKSHEETTERLANLGESMNELTELLNSRVQEVAELKREIQKLNADKNEALETFDDLAQNHTRELIIKNEETQRYIADCESRLNQQSIEISDLREKSSNFDVERSTCLVNVESMRQEIERLNNSLLETRSHRESLQSELASKEQELFRSEDDVRKYSSEIERLNEIVEDLQKSSRNTIDEANRRIREIEDRESSLKRKISELMSRESESLAQLYREISEKDVRVSNLQQTVVNLEDKIHDITTSCTREKSAETMESVDLSSSVKSTNDEIRHLRDTVKQLNDELNKKNEEIEDYRYQLSESTYPSIIQALQDQVNTLYEDKAKIEESLENALRDLSKERELRRELPENSRYQSRQLKSTFDEEINETRDTNDDTESRKTEEEIRNLRMQLKEREGRFADLQERYEIVEIETNELRLRLATKNEEIEMLQRKFESTSKEFELLRIALKKDLTNKDIENIRSNDGSSTSQTTRDQSSNELDLALYMLHQRDVRCDELTLELMQLLEERDTLQLRLSNAIRINEELRRTLPNETQTSEIIRDLGNVEPVVEQPSPSRSTGPVEIAKEAIDSPNEEKIALAHKLSQLHNMGHRRDVRLMDDRESRHNQQMSLLAHGDVLSTLPPEAAARIVNANYTLSRDVQSQSSILMNWLWGKSTPKVVHM